MEFAVVQGRIVLYKWAEDRFAPALITLVSEDDTVNLTVFMPDGTPEGKTQVKRGDNLMGEEQIGTWVPPGVSGSGAQKS